MMLRKAHDMTHTAAEGGWVPPLSARIPVRQGRVNLAAGKGGGRATPPGGRDCADKRFRRRRKDVAVRASRRPAAGTSATVTGVADSQMALACGLPPRWAVQRPGRHGGEAPA